MLVFSGFLSGLGFLPGLVARSCLFVMLALLVPMRAVYADDNAPVSATQKTEPEAKVSRMTSDLLALVKANETPLKENPAAVYGKIDALLESDVNFPYIAKNVMGAHWRGATDEQRSLFEQRFRQGLIETYTKGIHNFSNLSFDIESSTKKPIKNKTGKLIGEKASVVQTVTGPEGTNRILYTLLRRIDGEWKISNVVLNGVNLGLTLRNQFAQGVKDAKGDINLAISQWGKST